MIGKHFDQAQRLLEVDNTHSGECGVPQPLNASDRYLSYFENDHVEQSVFVGDRTASTALLYGGDIGWDRPLELTADVPFPQSVVLGRSEQVWLQACWMGFTGT